MRKSWTIALLVCSWFPVGASAASDAEAASIRDDAFNSSAVCGTCHEEIYEMWNRSVHSLAVTDPIFLSAYDRAYRETRGEASAICLRCHAPIAVETGDLDLTEPLSREGVTCDYCHSIETVDLADETAPLSVRLDGIKRGPLGDADSPAHGVVESDLHTASEFCAGCHEYANDEGLSIFSTYSEWKVSPQAKEGKTCQHCHMPAVPGNIVTPAMGVDRREINVHAISGGHSAEQVRKAASLRIVKVRRQNPTRAELEVEIANIGSGHCIPTGMPTRKLILIAAIYVDGREMKRFEKVYQRRLADAEGHPIEDDHAIILRARRLLEDNRLGPGERRVERFVASVPSRGKLSADVSLSYLYQPQILQRQRIEIQIAEETSR